jgi:SRSO17 transposase
LWAELWQRREQREWSAFYLCGQLANLERKTVEPMVLALRGPSENAMRGLQQFISQSNWSVRAGRERLQQLVTGWLGERDAVVIFDGSGFPKRGSASAGVAPQYCGALGKIANCQEGVFAVYSSSEGYAFVDGRLYVPDRWFGDDYAARRQTCGLPADLCFQTEPEIALVILADLLAAGHCRRAFWRDSSLFGRDCGDRKMVSGGSSQKHSRLVAHARHPATRPRSDGASPSSSARGPQCPPTAGRANVGGPVAALGLATLHDQGRQSWSPGGRLRLRARNDAAR